MANKKLLYFADPMCSWCWGFSPVIHEIKDNFSSQAPVHLHVGGLRAGNMKVMDKEQRLYILNHWFNVNEASGQPFDFSFNMADGFIYDTEPACRAVKTMQSVNEPQTLAYFSAIQKQFYADNVDVTQLDALSFIASQFEVDNTEFETAFSSDACKQATQQDFVLTQRLQVNGFPCLIGQDGESMVYISRGFQLYPQIEKTLTAWLKQ